MSSTDVSLPHRACLTGTLLYQSRLKVHNSGPYSGLATRLEPAPTSPSENLYGGERRRPCKPRSGHCRRHLLSELVACVEHPAEL
ncbi:hypothetical protein BDZ89DRAFT_1062671 [Hymenopellis radicata]|nr:hypothetical protein BDZ89DRAFT_1062671 [Hymenopellis radicata]